MQDRTVARLRSALEFLKKYHALPLGGGDDCGIRVTANGETGQTGVWLKTNVRKLRNAETTVIRAALVKLGALPPRGDEDRFEHILPDFLKNPFMPAGTEANVARSPRSKAKALTPNPFPKHDVPGGRMGSPFH